MRDGRRLVITLTSAFAFCLPTCVTAKDTTTLRGFDTASSAHERAEEARFMPIPTASAALGTSRVIDAHAHVAGSTGDYALAVYMRDRLTAFGFNATLETVRARIETPTQLLLALEPSNGVGVGLDLREAASELDPGPGRPDAGTPYNYGSGDGDVRAPLVYANRGLEGDYGVLSSAGIQVRGSILIVRYGAEFRGLLAERAQRHGAAGVVFYSDPKDDGFAKGPVYPQGPWRPLGSVQRGEVSDSGLAIPTLPVTAVNARALIAALGGRDAPSDWRGALPVTYRMGPSSVRAHLLVRLQRRVGELWNTIGTLSGRSNSAVILGAHRDAWVYGVTDNGSGISALLETARGLGALYRKGWRPRRTIVVAGWDGEEIGEVGSQSYVRSHATVLRHGGVAYINADQVVAGPHFTTSATAALGASVIAATKAVTGAGTKQPSAPGGGSDHEPFLFQIGIPVASFAYDGPFGVYHSAYDDLRYATTQSDPGFGRHRAIAQLLGVTAMRLANAIAVPYTFAPYATLMTHGSHALATRARTSRLAYDPAPLDRAIARFARAAPGFDARIAAAKQGLEGQELNAVRTLDKTIYGAVGYAPVTFPTIVSPLAAHDPAALKAAVKACAAAIDKATAFISS